MISIQKFEQSVINTKSKIQLKVYEYGFLKA